MSQQRTLRHDLVAMTLAAAAATIAMSANAAVDTFAKIGDIKGESIDPKHPGAIEVLSWSFGITALKRNAACSQELHITKFVDAATPKLMTGVALGKIHPTAVLTVRRTGTDPEDYLIVTMKEVLVTSVQPGASSGGEALESVSLAYSSADIVYKPQDPRGELGEKVEGAITATCP